MIVRTLDEWWEETFDQADFCFLCGEPLTFPAVYWAGSQDGCPTLWLHSGCVETFTDRRLRDVLELQLGKLKADRWLLEKKREAFPKLGLKWRV